MSRRLEFKCSVCGVATDTAPLEGPTYCPSCCPDHVYTYDPGDRKHYCDHCGQEPPYDWHGYDPYDYD